MNMTRTDLKKLIMECIVEGNFKSSPEATEFANDIMNKVLDRRRRKGWSDMSYPEAIRDMIAFKLTKEGWTKKIDAVTPIVKETLSQPNNPHGGVKIDIHRETGLMTVEKVGTRDMIELTSDDVEAIISFYAANKDKIAHSSEFSQ